VRVNPDIDARTHHKIATGKAENKFGIPISRAREIYVRAAKLKGLKVAGVDMHIGSQITELSPFEAAFARVADLVRTLRADGHAIQRIDLGGGLGVPYAPTDPAPPPPKLYGAAVSRAVADLNCELILEPGRLIAANAGVLVSRVTYVKEGEAKKFLILDAGMNDLIRPAMYDAHHEIVSVREGTGGSLYDVVGPVCESSDLFGRDRRLPEMKDGDLVAILTAGAYGAVMASAYNARPPAAEVLVKGSEWAVVRPRMSDDELIGLDRIPGWLSPQA
jgi:diaminopimelate decarboxylase